MRTLKIVAISLIVAVCGSCTELSHIAKTVANQNLPLTNTEIVAGLKEALLVGADSSIKRLSAVDGYLKDQAVKILLPPEAVMITDHISKLPGGSKLVEDVIIRINRAAEDAAKEAKPIFVNSVREMTLTDGIGILKGADNAATQYFKSKTEEQLRNLYRPKIRESLNKKLIAGISTQQSWNELTTNWNKMASSPIGAIAGLKTVDVKLEDYLLQQALNGLFLKIEEREKDIRTNANARVSALLQRVFGNTAL